MEHPIPPRFGNWNANVELAGGAKHPACGNPHYEYYQQLVRKHMGNSLTSETPDNWTDTFDEVFKKPVKVDPEELRKLAQCLDAIFNDNLCGKPHNNGEDTCLECEVIKHGE